jgi:hypothetical protein
MACTLEPALRAVPRYLFSSSGKPHAYKRRVSPNYSSYNLRRSRHSRYKSPSFGPRSPQTTFSPASLPPVPESTSYSRSRTARPDGYDVNARRASTTNIMTLADRMNARILGMFNASLRPFARVRNAVLLFCGVLVASRVLPLVWRAVGGLVLRGRQRRRARIGEGRGEAEGGGVGPSETALPETAHGDSCNPTTVETRRQLQHGNSYNPATVTTRRQLLPGTTPSDTALPETALPEAPNGLQVLHDAQNASVE